MRNKILYLTSFTFCFLLCLVGSSFAGPITIDNATAEPLPKGMWDIEFHYTYYDMSVIKNTAYWGYTQGNGHMDSMDSHDMKFLNQVLLYETYYGFTDRLTLGIVVPYLLRDVRKQPFVGNGEVSSNGNGDIALRACYNLFDPAKNFLGVSVGSALGLPTGNQNADPPLGDGRYETCLATVITRIFNDKIKGHLTLSYKWRFRNKDYEYWGMYSGIRAGNEFHYGLVGEYAASKKVNLFLEFSGWMAPVSEFSGGGDIPFTDYYRMDVVPGVQYKATKNLTLEFCLKIPVQKDTDFDFNIAPEIGAVYAF
jgi:hypothetical protein